MTCINFYNYLKLSMLLNNFLPAELVDKIYKIRHSLELKDVHDQIL